MRLGHHQFTVVAVWEFKSCHVLGESSSFGQRLQNIAVRSPNQLQMRLTMRTIMTNQQYFENGPNLILDFFSIETTQIRQRFEFIKEIRRITCFRYFMHSRMR